MGFSFKVSELAEKSNEYAPIDPGYYDVKMDTVEEKVNPETGDEQWSFKMKIVSEKFNGRTFFLNYNVKHSNEKTSKFAMDEIADIAKLIGVDDVNIKSIATNNIFTALIEQRPYNGKIYYNAKKWTLKSAVQPTFATPAPTTTTAAKKPWIK